MGNTLTGVQAGRSVGRQIGKMADREEGWDKGKAGKEKGIGSTQEFNKLLRK